ncbi:hypothetical protein ASPWEDRAFT_117646 [Aspergillus wentii DTO 134E9]|uniref:Glycoside hydrolase 131 catalytic N-terminal domain-containing protein n=1 Tax=Aspergillus wentii DTO 134E9 TaxID=1073089 RepID=A0A1L9RCB0_ASPWE|nr:uncharacterized protein ASPWEDRAFT_117646 [Aspergillus wentii DTO 134E9]OJJ32507.1 hypothetical protein ASPWEDRAFT_117646 [Aspergillus wentii DTO 134E9]
MKHLNYLLSLPALVHCGDVVWNGFFNSSITVDHFDQWSWSNQLEPFQWYIHGSGATSRYLGLAPMNKNPADESDAQGIRITIDDTSSWNGQQMMRSELIPQTSEDLGSGHLFYHFSLKTNKKNAPNPKFEHQIAFFESHFTELQYGQSGGSDNTLKWNADGQTHWSTTLQPRQWYNFAYEIDFDAKTVGLWASNGTEALTQVVKGVSASTSTNSADWHVGQLRLDNGDKGGKEDWFWSGVYVEKGPVTTSVKGPSS